MGLINYGDVMTRELALHPETGRLVEVVHSYQDLELDQLREDVNTKTQAVEEAQGRRDTKQQELDALNKEVEQAEAALEDSKSTLSRGAELVGQPAGEVDAGADGTSGQAEAEVAGADGNF